MSELTLRDVRDYHLRQVARCIDDQYPRGVQRHQKMADAIDAHLNAELSSICKSSPTPPASEVVK
jgi:hypothetical protein